MMICEKKNNINGFTMIETLVSISVLVILFFITIPIFKNFTIRTDLDQAKETIIDAIRLAQKRTTSSQFQGNWGVLISTSTIPSRAIIFFGKDYASRDSSRDEYKDLPASVLINNINPSNMNEIVFERISGKASTSASIELSLINDPSSETSIFLDSSGHISPHSFAAAASDNRQVDTRHAHVVFSGTVDTANDNIYIDFDNGTHIEIVPISANLVGSQFDWEGKILVSGREQSLQVKTIRLNNPDTEFCIIRDRRYNDKSIELHVGDTAFTSDNLINFSADGLSAATGTSFLVSGPIWQ